MGKGAKYFGSPVLGKKPPPTPPFAFAALAKLRRGATVFCRAESVVLCGMPHKMVR